MQPSPAAEPWCRSCGATATAADTACPVCGVALDPPDPGPLRVGRVVTIQGRMTSKVAIAVDERDGNVSVLAKADDVQVVPIDRFDGLEPVAVPGPPVRGAAGRVWAANQARAAGAVKAKWPAEFLDQRAVDLALSSPGMRRAAALDALTLGANALLQALPLTPAELTWYSALLADAGPPAALLDLLERLPADGYPGRVALLLRKGPALLADPAAAARARAQLVPLLDGAPAGFRLDARALYEALGNVAAPDIAELLRGYALERFGAEDQIAQAVGLANAAVEQVRRPPHRPPSPAPALAALDAYAAGLAGERVDERMADLAVLPPVLLDDLIRAGALTRPPQGESPLSAPVTSYLRGRLTPGEATDADLRAVGFAAEQARRCYLAGDDDGLAALPAGDPAVAHYAALAGYRRDGAIDRGLLAPAVADLLALLDEVRDGGDEVREVPLGIALDPSCWPPLREAAVAGLLAAPAGGNTAAFAAWLELCRIVRLLQDGEFSGAVSAGTALARTAEPPVRAEARNMVSYAQWRLGDATTALHTLQEALREHPSAGAAVNAGILAGAGGTGGGLVALPYLRQAADAAADPAVRAAVLGRALDVGAPGAGAAYPPDLQHLVRAALDAEQADEIQRRMLAVSADHDAVWLADARVFRTGPGQDDAIAYYRAVARTRSPAHRAGTGEVAAALVAAAGRTPREPWVDREIAAVTVNLAESVRRPFGEAAAVVPLIEGLVAADVLALPDRIALSVRAAAHIAFGLEERQQTIPEPVEQRLVFESVRLYGERETELPSDRLPAVRADLAVCVSGVAACVWAATARAVQRLVVQFNELQERRRWDQPSVAVIATGQRGLLGSMDRAVARCNLYLHVLVRLPLDPAAAAMRDAMTADVQGWAAEIALARPTV